MSNKVVDLRKERERRDGERRGSLIESVTSVTKEDTDKPKEDNTNKNERTDEHKEQQREGIFWEAPEYEYREKQQGVWIRNALIIAAPLIVIFILIKNVLGAFLVLFGAVAFLLEAFREPRVIEYGIDKRGVVVGGLVTPYKKLESFWIFPKEQGNMLSLIRKGKHGKRVSATPFIATKKERLQDLERASEEDSTSPSQHRGLFGQHLKLPIGDTDRDAIYDALSSHIEEKEQHPSISDSWLRRIGY